MPSSLACGTSDRCRRCGRHGRRGPVFARQRHGTSGTASRSRRWDAGSSVRRSLRHRPHRADHRPADGRWCRYQPSGLRDRPEPVSARPGRGMSGTAPPSRRWDGESWSGGDFARLMAGGAGVGRAACVVGRDRLLPALSVACEALPFHAGDGMRNCRGGSGRGCGCWRLRDLGRRSCRSDCWRFGRRNRGRRRRKCGCSRRDRRGSRRFGGRYRRCRRSNRKAAGAPHPTATKARTSISIAIVFVIRVSFR